MFDKILLSREAQLVYQPIHKKAPAHLGVSGMNRGDPGIEQGGLIPRKSIQKYYCWFISKAIKATTAQPATSTSRLRKVSVGVSREDAFLS